MKSIAILHPSLINRGGAENVVVWLAEALSKKGFRVCVYVSEYDEEFFGLKEEKKYEIKELHVKGDKYNILSFFYWVKAGFKLRKELEEFDVINPHNFPSYIWFYIARKFNKKLAAKKVIWYCEEPFRAFYTKITDQHCLEAKEMRDKKDNYLNGKKKSFFNKVIEKFKEKGIKAPFPFLKAKIEAARFKIVLKHGEKIDRKVVPTLGTTLTNSEFIADNMYKIFSIKCYACPLGIPINKEILEGKHIIGEYLLTVSRITFEKNIFSILKAVKILKDEGRIPFSKYVIIGDGPERLKMEEYVKKSGIGSVVEFKGFVSNKVLREAYNNAGAVIYLPLDETFGLVYLEAAQYEKPVIGPDHGGPTELVINEKTGYTVDALNEREIADKIIKIFSNKEKMYELGQNGLNNLISKYKFDDFVKRFEKFL